jgi:hypothetical protein
VAGHAEIVVESHSARQECHCRRAHPHRYSNRCRDPLACAGSVGRPTRIEREIVDTVHIDIDAVQERFDVRLVHALRKGADIQVGIDVPRHFHEDIDLGAPDGARHCADLAIEVVDFEAVELGEAELADPHAGECQQVHTTHTTQAGNGDPLPAKRDLLLAGHPADVAGNCVEIVVRLGFIAHREGPRSYRYRRHVRHRAVPRQRYCNRRVSECWDWRTLVERACLLDRVGTTDKASDAAPNQPAHYPYPEADVALEDGEPVRSGTESRRKATHVPRTRNVGDEARERHPTDVVQLHSDALGAQARDSSVITGQLTTFGLETQTKTGAEAPVLKTSQARLD